MAYKVLLFLGAGRNVGASTVELFKNEGYRVASVARTTHDNVKKHSDLCLTADFSDPSSIEGAFKRVEKELGVPNVVIYNPFSWAMPSDPSDPVSVSLESFQRDLAINTASPYAAAQAAVKGFKKLPRTTKTTFIYTGNNGNTLVLPIFLSLGLGKTAAWYMIQTMVATPAFAAAGYRFYYVDERTPEGKALHYTSGAGHARFFLQLAEQEKQGKPLATFVRGKGYTGFKRDQCAILPAVRAEDAVDSHYGAPGSEEWKFGR